MLQSVLRGEVIKSEKKRLLNKDIFQQRNSIQEIWLSLRALLRGRTITDEMKFLQESRQSINEVVESIMKFRVDDHSADPALLQVAEVLKCVDRVESLYATRAEMIRNHPNYNAAPFQIRLDALNAWCTVTRSLHMQFKILRDWTGSDDLQVSRTTNLGEKDTGIQHNSTSNNNNDNNNYQHDFYYHHKLASKDYPYSNTDLLASLSSTSSSYNTNTSNSSSTAATQTNMVRNNSNSSIQHQQHQQQQFKLNQKNSSFVERILRESALQDTFDKRTLSALNCLLLKSKQTMMANHRLFQNMNLPPFFDELKRLAHFPSRLVEEALKLRLESKDRVTDPPKQMVDAMLEDFHGLLSLACRVKKQYQELASPAPGWVMIDDDTLEKNYKNVVMDSVQFYFKLITWKIDFEKENSLRECEVLEKEWEFLLSTICCIDDEAYYECTEQFCALTNRQLQDTMNDLNNIISMNASDEDNDIETKYSRLLHTIGMRARKLLQFAKSFVGNFENAAEYLFDTECLNNVIRYLELTGHFFVRTNTFEDERIYMIASPSLYNRPDMIATLAHSGFKAPKEEDIPGTPNNQFQLNGYESAHYFTNPYNPEDTNHSSKDYIFFIAPWQHFYWSGDVYDVPLPLVNINLKPRRMRLVTHVPRHLKGIKSQFWASVKHYGLGIIREQRCHSPKIHKDIRPIKATIYKLTETIIHSVYSLRDLTTLNTERHELVEEAFSFASDFGMRVSKLFDPRHRLPLDLTLTQLAIQWICFITDECNPMDQRTFRWAVTALEFGQLMTKGTNMLALGEADFSMLQSKVARCIALLISHFDVLGTRWTFEVQQKEEQRKRGITARRNSYITSNNNNHNNSNSNNNNITKSNNNNNNNNSSSSSNNKSNNNNDSVIKNENESSSNQNNIDNRRNSNGSIRRNSNNVNGGTSKESNNHNNSSNNGNNKEVVGNTDVVGNEAAVAAAHRYIRDAWMRDITQLETERNKMEQEAKIVGKVLDDQKPEDQSLVFLAPSSSNISFRWQQGRYIGAGTFGQVYLAINLDTSSIMAVKEIRFPDSSALSALHKAIKEEMKVMEMLHHRNIVQYYGMEVHREKVNIFMEYCENGSLGSLLEAGGRIEAEYYIVDYAYQILCGLAYLHDNNIVHRDIKPDNILIDHQGQLKLSDFGASKIIAHGHKTLGKATLNVANSLTGTPMYMAPEIITGGDTGRKGSMDIWSLGCCVVQMATGRRPWSTLDNEWSVMFHVVTGHPPLPDPSQMSSSGISFLKKCFIRNPKERPTAYELLEDPWIKNYLEHGIIENDEQLQQQQQQTETTNINKNTTTIPSSPPPSPYHENPQQQQQSIEHKSINSNNSLKGNLPSLPTPSTSASQLTTTTDSHDSKQLDNSHSSIKNHDSLHNYFQGLFEHDHPSPSLSKS
ncbi:hypothetical protein BJ944DRAFT_291624 [Cunninghamella echinulata]|nr:hypothetical protein BJ944DRAFT_291624 [Cunninghamella echinulata]